MKKLLSNFILKMLLLLFLLQLLFAGCSKEQLNDYFSKYKKSEKNITKIISKKDGIDALYNNNLINIKNGFPFYIITTEAFLTKKRPCSRFCIPNDYVPLKFGDILFPVEEKTPTKYFFYVKTINDEYGWIYSGNGISLNYNEDVNLYYFSDQEAEYYLSKYKATKGEIDTSSKIVLLKNVVPLLLGNYSTNGWFYPENYQLALELSKFASESAINKNTYFYAASSYDWRVNEVVISKNLLADSYQKLGFLEEAEKTHLYLKEWYFWRYADNTRIGGLNSIVKLEKIYLEKLNKVNQSSVRYQEIKQKLVNTILVIGDEYNVITLADMKWHSTAAEWTIEILRSSLSREEFYNFANKLKKQTTSEGFEDMVNVYIALEMYKEGKKEEALKILTSTRPKKKFKYTLRINDWLSANKMIPDSVIYQYKF